MTDCPHGNLRRACETCDLAAEVAALKEEAAIGGDLAVAGRKAAEWTARRDQLIRQAVAEGGTLREVGALAGLSHTAIKLICQRGTMDR